MSFFGKIDINSNWSGVIKQALTQVETHLDKVLDLQPGERPIGSDHQQTSSAANSSLKKSKNTALSSNDADNLFLDIHNQNSKAHSNLPLKDHKGNTRPVNNNSAILSHTPSKDSRNSSTSQKISKSISANTPITHNINEILLNKNESQVSLNSNNSQSQNTSANSPLHINKSYANSSKSLIGDTGLSASPKASAQSSQSRISDRTESKKTAILDLYATFGIDPSQVEPGKDTRNTSSILNKTSKQLESSKVLNNATVDSSISNKTFNDSMSLDGNYSSNTNSASKTRFSAEVAAQNKVLNQVPSDSKTQKNLIKYQQLVDKLNSSIRATNEYQNKYEDLLKLYNSEKAESANSNFRKLSNKYKVVEKELQNSKESMQALKIALERSDLDCSGLTSELQELKKNNINLSQLNLDLQAKNNDLEKSILDLKQLNDDLQEKLGSLERKLLILEDESRTRDAMALLQTRELRKQKRQIEDEKSNISNIIMQNSAPIMKKVETLQKSLSLKQKEFSLKEAEFNEAQSEWQTKDTSFQNKINELKNRLQEFELNQQELELKSQQYIKMEKKESETENLLNQLKQEISLLQNENNSLKENIDRVSCEKKVESVSNKSEVSNNSFDQINTHPNQFELNDKAEIGENISAKTATRFSDKDESSSTAKNADSTNDTEKQKYTDAEMKLAKKDAELVEIYNKYNTKLSLEEEYDNMEKRYSASLVLLGERTEQVMDLKEEISEIKSIYKKQIEEYVSKK
ncbi:hypothetical protein BB561_000104 [Smittium simulii]|uniref:TATA element modulatory factor 1 TATA binding domain-containing protein n=1 Tax=Smittium simulii TaxID=133385 RepID=A0A2T9Z0N8_9FUNG|nr:hypothetical protein BB561_000104 [Smittium simulii]